MWHMQRTTPGWLDSVRLLPNSASIKATGGYEIFIEIKAINPNIFTIHRHVREEFEQYQGSLASGWFNWEEATRIARAKFDAFVDGTFRDKIAPHTDAVSWHNEIWADSQNIVERRERIAAAQAAVFVWNKEYRPTFSNDIQLIIGEAAPGNGMPREIGALAIESDNIVGYHPYEWWRRGVRSPASERLMTSQRYTVMEHEWGLKPTWAFTEAGPLESAVTGWRAKECLGGDTTRYVEAVRLWIQDVAKSSAYQEGRVRGFNLFTTFSPGDEKWGTFHTQQPEMNLLAAMIKEEWKPGTYTSPTTPPTTPPNGTGDFREEAWAITVEKQVTGNGGLRLNPKAAIQARITRDNIGTNFMFQVVTDETKIQGKTVQAAESLTGLAPRRVYVWEEGKPIYYFEDPEKG